MQKNSLRFVVKEKSMQQLLLIIHILVCVTLIVLILLQHGKGADAGAAYGGGASQTVFGSQGSTSFLVKVTSGLAVLFFSTCLLLGYLTLHQAKQASEINVLTSPIPDSGNRPTH